MIVKTTGQPNKPGIEPGDIIEMDGEGKPEHFLVFVLNEVWDGNKIILACITDGVGFARFRDMEEMKDWLVQNRHKHYSRHEWEMHLEGARK